jgi:hypothetical protein
MTLIVEDGNNIVGANSYVSLEDARAYAQLRGSDLSSDNTVAISQLIKGFDFVEAYESRYGGKRSFRHTAFPRTGSCVNGFEIEADEVLPQVGYAQVQVALSIESGFDPMPVLQFADIVTKEKVGPLETTFAEPTSLSQMTPQVTAAVALLKPFFGSVVNQMTAQRI